MADKARGERAGARINYNLLGYIGLEWFIGIGTKRLAVKPQFESEAEWFNCYIHYFNKPGTGCTPSGLFCGCTLASNDIYTRSCLF